MINNYVSKPCGGMGTCGKCRIKIINGFIDINERDKKFLSDEELKSGMRIACGHNLDDVDFISINDDFEVLSNYKSIESSEKNKDENKNKNKNDYAVIIDVGTTTICFQLISAIGQILNTISISNSQRVFGADVISRISKATAGGFPQLCSMLKNDLKKGIYDVIHNITDEVSFIYIAGNTTMTYFLREMNCRGIGVYPFENNATDVFKKSTFEFFDRNFNFDAKVFILPCIQAFVGGDVVSVAFFIDFKKQKNCIFIDIGTNGEIMLNSEGKLFCSSVAVGPAFEGGLISCGIGAVSGAINKISFNDGNFDFQTINSKDAIGICGSALIDLLALLLDNKIMDCTGLLKDEYFLSGVQITDNVYFKQKDIRQLQLAKSAVYSGVQCILKYAGMKFSDVEKVFVGGGFGFYLNVESAFKIKMLPDEFRGKIEICGNTALGGLYKLFKTGFNDFESYVLNTETINIAEMEEFNDLFVENLNF